MRPLSVHVLPYQTRFVRPFQTAVGTLTQRCGLIVRVTDAEGRCGYGEAAPLPGFSDETLVEVACEFEGLADVPWPEAFARLDTLESISVACSTLLQSPSARHGLELALCDLLAQDNAIPLVNLFNPAASLHGETARVARQSDDALAAVQDGVRTIKVKVGFGSLEDDVARISEIRRVVGTETNLRLDANGAWTTAIAIESLERLSAFDIECIEQPVAAQNLNGLAEVKRHSKIRVAADEAVRSAEDLRAVMESKAADIVVLKPMLCGGPIAAWDMSRRAAKAGLPVIITSSLDGAVGRLGAMHVAAAIPEAQRLSAGVDTGRWLEADYLDLELVEHGRFVLESTPGLGLAEVGAWA